MCESVARRLTCEVCLLPFFLEEVRGAEERDEVEGGEEGREVEGGGGGGARRVLGVGCLLMCRTTLAGLGRAQGLREGVVRQ